MKKLITIILVALSFTVYLAMCGNAYAPDHLADVSEMVIDPSPNYMALMIEAATKGDHEAGEAAEVARGAKIDAMGLATQKIAYEDLYLLAKIIRAEAGDVSEDIQLRVGEVVMNRVEHPSFPDTVEAVIKQSGQYWYPSMAERFEALTLDGYEHCVRIALRLLEGERAMTPDVIYQANFEQGSGVYAKLWSGYSWSYFCEG